MRTIFFTLFLALCFSSCKKQAVPVAVDDSGLQYFGEKISEEGSISFDQLMTKMETQDSVLATVSGKVESVCKVKGCWMNIVSPTKSDSDEIFVKFKDYGFFMPLDCHGQDIVMRGKAYREVTSVDELRHYAEDEGKSEEDIAAITEPLEELKFMADGVILKP